MPKQQPNTTLLVTARRWMLAIVAMSSLLASLMIAPAHAEAESSTAAHRKPAAKVAPTAAVVLTKWQKEERVIKKYNAKKKLSVTKKHKAVAKLYAKHYLHTKYKKSSQANKQYKCFVKVVNYESKWNWKAKNSRGYYGLPQTKSSMKKYGSNWKHHYKPQVQWGHSYMKKRYGSPCGAWKKIKRSGWY